MDWLLRLETAPDDAALRAAFDAWLDRSEANRKAFRVMGHTWDRLGALPRDLPSPSARPDDRSKPSAPVPKRRFGRYVAVAAVALAACVVLWLMPTLQLRVLADHVTGVAELREVVLEDGSIVHLDAGSAISLNYGTSRREVALLAGQAFFEVAADKGRPFRVQAGGVRVTVTGTSFGVRTSPETVSVAVQTGTVEVSLDDGRQPAATLSRGERLVVDRGSRGIVRSEIAPEEVASWRSRRLVVHDAMLDDVVEELGRHYVGFIMLRDRKLSRQLISGVFDLTRPVEALNAVAESQGGKLTEITPYLLVIAGR